MATSPTSPTRHPPGFASILSILGAVALVTAAAGIVAIPCVAADAFNCTLIAHANGQFEDVWGYTSESREYALACAVNRLDIFDVTGPGPITLVSSVPSLGFDLQDVKTRGSYAFAVNQTGPMQVIDLSVPELAYTAAVFSTPNIPGAHTIHIDGDYAFLSLNGVGARDLRIVDITNPLQPVEVGHWTHPEQENQVLVEAHDCFVRQDTCYVAYLQGGFAVLDVSDRTAPQTIALVDYPSAVTHSCALTSDGRYLLTTDETPDGPLRIWDLADPGDIRQVATYVVAPNRIIHDVHVLGTRAYISYYTEGLRVVDLETPTRPVEVAFFDTFPGDDATLNGNWGVYPFAPLGKIYLSDRSTGLWVVTAGSGPVGTVMGTVRDAVSGEPLPQAAVRLIEADKVRTTNPSGAYQHATAAGLHTLATQHVGYASDTALVTITPGPEAVLHHVNLNRLGGGALGGRVTANGGGPAIAGARVEIRGLDLNPALTGPAGDYAFTYLWAGTRVVTAGTFGYWPGIDSVTVAAGTNLVAGGGSGGSDTLNFALAPGIFDDFEANQGWMVGSPTDSAVAGIWERGDPGGTHAGGRPVEPENDHTAGFGTFCYVTGKAATGDPPGQTDVDDGRTTLLSPVFDLTGVPDPHLRYHRWFSNNEGANDDDVFVADISSDGGASWTNIETLASPTPSWQPVIRRLADLVAPSAAMQLRFVASDFGGPSMVEAAVDDLVVTSDPIGVPGDEPAPVTALAPHLDPVAPNPSGPPVRIAIHLPAAATEVRLAVHHPTGRLVRSLHEGPLAGGIRVFTWDGRDARGARAPSGLYLVSLRVAGRAAGSQPLVLLR